MDTMSPNLPQRKSLIIFVHGFNSDPNCWDSMLKLMGEDPVMTAAFDWKRFSYDSKITYGLFNVLARLPDYEDITAKFDQFLADSFTSTYDQLYLAGHSQGGLIISRGSAIL
jgi:pimeloyl-ACP methyl ester carboxylesterase